MTGYGLDDWMIGGWFLVRAGNFSLWHHIQTSSGALPDRRDRKEYLS